MSGPTRGVQMTDEKRLREYLRRATTELADARRRLAEAETAGDEPIAVIGMACRFPGADTPDAYWDLLAQGRSAAADQVPDGRFDLTPYVDRHGVYTQRGAFLDDIAGWDADFFGVSPREAVRMDPQQRLLMELLWETLESAGLDASAVAGSRTGVLVGFSDSLQYGRLQGDRQGAGVVTDPFLGQGSAASVVAGRLAYHFDLHGPTVTLDTACSSSLVAVHLAAAALRRGECDVALAGGGSLVIHPDVYATGCATSMLSPQGMCRTFDANADGYLLGEGGGMVALTRLSDARRAGHRVRAVLTGSAVNQDGRSNGLTAPSRSAQVEVIRRALDAARVAPDDVDYVEAHGSGTALGDAIELGALDDVFGRRSPARPLHIGAVKTNIGHTQAAAGMAGLIKTVLVLEKGTVPPNLNVTEPSTAVPPSGALRPADGLLRLPETGRSLVAGVSSFGWSGTNAHVVLAAAPSGTDGPAPGPAAGSRRYRVLPLSAHAPAAADEAARRLGAHLAAAPGTPLSSVARTLQTGRKTFEHRRVAVAASTAAAAASLSGEKGSAPLLGRTDTTRGRRAAFLLAGVGEQYPGMVGELHRREPVFREHLDACLDRLSRLMPHVDHADLLVGPRIGGGGDLAALLGRATTVDPREKEMQRTEVVQPLMFAVDYAVARTLMAWGVTPSSMLGFSLGEYVAACLAGVFSLDDALALVVRRAQLIATVAPGAMAAVPLSPKALGDRFDLDRRGVDIAVAAGPESVVVAGAESAVRELVEELRAAGTPCRPLATTHAFHSRMLAPLSGQLTAWVTENITLHPPVLPYLSNVTGRPVDGTLVCDPAYWARHMCETVRFAECADTLLADPGLALVEIGPGPSLGAMVRGLGCPPEIWPLITATLPAATDPRPADETLADCLARLWLTGVTIDWPAHHGGDPAAAAGTTPPVPLPAYPFQRRRYWIEDGAGGTTGTTESPDTVPLRPASLEDITRIPRLPEEEWLSLPVWRQTVPPAPDARQPGHWLVLSKEGAADEILAGLLTAGGASGARVSVVRPGTAFRQTPGGYTVRPGSAEDMVALLTALRADGLPLERAVHLWTLTDRAEDGTAVPAHGGSREEDHDTVLAHGLHTVLALARAAGELALDSWSLDLVTAGTQRVLDEAGLRPAAATLLGPLLVVPQEYPGVRTRLVDVRPGTAAAQVVAELRGPRTAAVVALHSGRRWVSGYGTVPPAPLDTARGVLRERGVYLVTGGLGGIGLGMAEHLARDCRARLVLLGRNGLPPRERWAAVASGEEESDPVVRERVTRVTELLALGAEVEIVVGDVADPDAVRRAVDVARTEFGALHGVLHAAGVAGTGLMQFKERDDIERVLAPKLAGTRAIAAALQIGEPDEQPLDFLVLFSSITSATGGGPGQVAYCAANAYLDAYAQRCAAPGRRVLSVNWGEWTWNAWDEGLESYDRSLEAFFRTHRAEVGIGFAEGWRSLLRSLATGEPQVLVSTQDLPTMVRFSDWYTVDALTAPLGEGTGQGARYPRPELMTPYQEPSGPTETRIAEVWCDALGLERVGVDDNFFELGGNSLLGIRILATLRETLGGVELPPHILFEAPNIAALARTVDPPQDGGARTGPGTGSQDRARLRRSGLQAAARRRR
ncbi:SDR family NAD(P)-dependent oxidoreductase [Streptomyces sp. NPDC056452]|uniref:type I polyketide synthase n=1 Tax=Streptomyces sp. NPDC056452 TaxID=3345821 RepID=UPI0036BE6DCA